MILESCLDYHLGGLALYELGHSIPQMTALCYLITSLKVP